MSAIAGRVLLIPKGNYDSATTYTMLDMVVYNGSSYICKQECTGVVPTNTTYWMLNASGSAVAYLNDIGDVVITNVSNGQVLMYDSTTQKWVNGTLSTTLAGLTDTQIASLQNGQVLKYNATSQKWENAEDTGGLLPHLIVISETGSTVTATKGQTVITATETSTGHFECDLPEFGTWTIDAILGGDDAQVSLVVDTVKVYTVDDSHFHATVTVKYPDGATCRLQSTDETLYATSSPYTFTVHHAETYTITVTYNQRIYTDTVTFTTEGQSFSKTLPSPSEVDANDIDMWLFFGGVSGTFSTLADILGNSTALSMLMASEDAVDYLVRCKEWISNEGLVPVMTSDTTPSGECITSGIYSSGYNAYKAFDGDDTTYYSTANPSYANNSWVGYKFTNAVKVKKLAIKLPNTTNYLKKFKLQGSNDGTNYTDIGSEITLSVNTNLQTFNINGTTDYMYYRILATEIVASTSNTWSVATLQFYAKEEAVTENQSAMSYIGLNNYCANTLLADSDWRDGIANSEYIENVMNIKVPTMTGDTTPSGTVFYTSQTAPTSLGNWYAWEMFDGDRTKSQGWNPYYSDTVERGGYQFTSQKNIKIIHFALKVGGTNSGTNNFSIKFIGSNDGTNWVDLTDAITISGNYEGKISIPNNVQYDRYAIIKVTGKINSNTGNWYYVPYIQFYGREDV